MISDEIHAPLVQPGVEFTPFLSASPAAARIGYALASASKAFNLAGLKCALMVTAGEEPARVVSSLPAEVEWRTGLFGALAAVAAFSEESDAWLDARARRARCQPASSRRPPRRARSRAPDIGSRMPGSSPGWTSRRSAGATTPRRRILRDAKVALLFGPLFGEEGKGHVRINFGCSPEVLREAVERIGALVGP